jgi:hypothetical protein
VDKQLEVLRRACRSKDVPPEEVLAAMQAVEAAHAQQPLVQGAAAAPGGISGLLLCDAVRRGSSHSLGPLDAAAAAGFPAALTGTWRLVFSTPSPIKQWQYSPVLENAVIDADAGAQLRG